MSEKITLTLRDLETMVKHAGTTDVLKRKGVSTFTQFRLSKLVKIAMKEIEPLEIVKETLLEKYGEKKEDGTLNMQKNGTVVIMDIKAYNKEWKEVIDKDIEIDFEPFTFECFKDTEFNGEDFLVFGKVILD